LRVQEERFFASAIENERVASFEPRDELALASLVSEEKRNRILLHRLPAGAPHIDQLSSLACLFQGPRWNLVIVDDNVGAPQALEPMHSDEAGISGPGPNQVNSWILHE
jgi:hypothetical protein